MLLVMELLSVLRDGEVVGTATMVSEEVADSYVKSDQHTVDFFVYQINVGESSGEVTFVVTSVPVLAGDVVGIR